MAAEQNPYESQGKRFHEDNVLPFARRRLRMTRWPTLVGLVVLFPLGSFGAVGPATDCRGCAGVGEEAAIDGRNVAQVARLLCATLLRVRGRRANRVLRANRRILRRNCLGEQRHSYRPMGNGSHGVDRAVAPHPSHRARFGGTMRRGKPPGTRPGRSVWDVVSESGLGIDRGGQAFEQTRPTDRRMSAETHGSREAVADR